MLNAWLHLVALIVYLGAIIGLWMVFLPSMKAVVKHQDRVQFLARGLKFYNPLQIGSLGIVLFSGALQLTELKAAYRETFVSQFGYDLGIKLLCAFFLVLFSVYQAMGIGHRFLRRQQLGEPVTPEQLNATMSRLKAAHWGILLLALITLWLGLRLRP